MNYILGFFFDVFLCFQCLAAKSLFLHAKKIQKSLEKKEDLKKTRLFLSKIVGRDTQNLNDEQIIKATVETIAENTTDGITSPLFFMLIFGPIGAVIFKAISTQDSMIGYHCQKYEYLGKTAARLDDAANFLPARITAFFMMLSCFFLKLDAKNALKTFFKEHNKTKSPNAGCTESTVAGALGMRLQGDAYYSGVLEKKEYIGEEKNKPAPKDIEKALSLMWTSYILFFLVGIGLKLIFLFLL